MGRRFRVLKPGWMVLFVLLFLPVPVHSETGQTNVSNAAPVVSQAQVDAFAALQKRLDRISDKYEKKTAGADAGNTARAQLKASEEMSSAIRQSGLGLAEYHRIAGAVIADEGTRRRVLDSIEQQQKSTVPSTG